MSQWEKKSQLENQMSTQNVQIHTTLWFDVNDIRRIKKNHKTKYKPKTPIIIQT